MFMSTNCMTCNRNLLETGKIANTVSGVIVYCEHCKAVYLPEFAGYSHDGRTQYYLNPIKSGVISNRKNQNLVQSKLQEKIQQAKTPTQLIESLNE